MTRKMLFTTPWSERFKWGFRFDWSFKSRDLILYYWTPRYIYSVVPLHPQKTWCKTQITIWMP